MTSQERKDKIEQLLTIHFEDEADYTRSELEAMDDAELAECYDAEINTPAADDELHLELCCVCKKMKVCPFQDEENKMPVCQQCADEAEADDEIIDDEDAADEGQDDDDDDDQDDEDDDQYDEDDFDEGDEE
jgi:hypothetical protein